MKKKLKKGVSGQKCDRNLWKKNSEEKKIQKQKNSEKNIRKINSNKKILTKNCLKKFQFLFKHKNFNNKKCKNLLKSFGILDLSFVVPIPHSKKIED